ncbi:hypothetical protein [Mucilaginibacter sp. OK268]|uniref:hypothetical protein n=1 Tax=Mucilaginibacter sp. OK268 TaxID=1881048 RepID=UPI000B84F405|nr:hypothetical protein [Mucilaginibacter sp. OK268]
MRSKLFQEKPKMAKIGGERWVRIIPDTGEGYLLYDVLQEVSIGCILFDADDNWIYDGESLTVDEQEEAAGFINGNHKEMDRLIRDLGKR